METIRIRKRLIKKWDWLEEDKIYWSDIFGAIKRRIYTLGVAGLVMVAINIWLLSEKKYNMAIMGGIITIYLLWSIFYLYLSAVYQRILRITGSCIDIRYSGWRRQYKNVYLCDEVGQVYRFITSSNAISDGIKKRITKKINNCSSNDIQIGDYIDLYINRQMQFYPDMDGVQIVSQYYAVQRTFVQNS